MDPNSSTAWSHDSGMTLEWYRSPIRLSDHRERARQTQRAWSRFVQWLRGSR